MPQDYVLSCFKSPCRHIQNLFFLSIICFLFRPSFNSMRYAYSELEGTPRPQRPSWGISLNCMQFSMHAMRIGAPLACLTCLHV